jgi:hypothetical protein
MALGYHMFMKYKTGLGTTLELRNRPLSGSDRDRELLKGRESDVQHALRAVDFGLNTLVLSRSGMGRTSFLRTCERELKQRQRTTVWVAGALLESAQELLDIVAYQLKVPRTEFEPSALTSFAETFSFVSGRHKVQGEPWPLLNLIQGLRSRLESRNQAESPTPDIVIVDDLRPEIVHTLFGRARDELWSLPLLWIVSADKERAADYLKPPADTFFGRTIDLAPLAESDAMDVLKSRVGDRLGEVDASRIVSEAQGNPRRLLTLAIDALIDDEEGTVDAALEKRRTTAEKLEALGPSAQRMWELLEQRGQAATNDPILLGHLGWSRVRASQVLNQLEKAGLVESSRESGSRGRPRKVYRIPSTMTAAGQAHFSGTAE